MERYELYVPPVVNGRNEINGRFTKGHKPHNKGKEWSEWMSEEGAIKAAKGWKNLDLHRNKNGRADNAGRCRKKVVAIYPDGTFRVFNSVSAAARYIGGGEENVGRCCHWNKERRVNKKTGRVNTDHKYKGCRLYFESDPIWMDKINK